MNTALLSVTEQCPMSGILCTMVQNKLAAIVTKANNNNMFRKKMF
jgi:hypothetical protein